MSSPAYRRAHQQERERWRPTVEAGEALCSEPVCLIEADGGDRWIDPESGWDLAHDPTDPTRTTYLGPAHARCNRSEGATRGNRARARQQGDWWEL